MKTAIKSILFEDPETGEEEAFRGCIYRSLCDGDAPADILQELQEKYEDKNCIPDPKDFTLSDIHAVQEYYKKEIREERTTRNKKADQEARWKLLKAQGKPFEQIARETKADLQTVLKWAGNNTNEIRTIDAVHLEALKETYPVFKAQRLAVLGEQINRLREELLKRDLADVPTTDLFRNFGQLVKLTKDEDPQEPTSVLITSGSLF